MSKSNSHADEPTIIADTNLSRAWARLFLQIFDSGRTEISPLTFSLTGFDADGGIAEIAGVRESLDRTLKLKKKISVETVAFTIFPDRLWKIARGDRKRLFSLYAGAFPRYVAMNRAANGRGLYFERMTNFSKEVPCDGNQLEFILSSYNERAGVRDTMLQVSIFDPARDHIRMARVGFPCLQHVSFVPTKEGLAVNAFYATQYVFDKAYGNYLGLARLGAFMAHELNLPLARLNVTVGVANLDGVRKSDASLAPLIAAARAAVAPAAPPKAPRPGVSARGASA
ncbi:thymidylate synthase [Bradyrhizobium diazoefficiens]|nr:thymidylate synthase [Bradyrhizobium diazoefficiens]UCF55520.1 MAG: thymidylate synthase [Bradyrhizobium sp.]MBR0966958.1 thymidylate synthase [Bradyrhizobium diazoefficiens]MBR0980596.1 thymidylate synthase [Bradyrhizobium diazoefficiens]MBR1009944.1 thymidylate synthase [Bradyrhizobium diazoefficiens]MBR1016527.1 thymidylate synthase [Bradyrhizobium diazoefficiens]